MDFDRMVLEPWKILFFLENAGRTEETDLVGERLMRVAATCAAALMVSAKYAAVVGAIVDAYDGDPLTSWIPTLYMKYAERLAREELSSLEFELERLFDGQ